MYMHTHSFILLRQTSETTSTSGSPVSYTLPWTLPLSLMVRRRSGRVAHLTVSCLVVGCTRDQPWRHTVCGSCAVCCRIHTVECGTWAFFRKNSLYRKTHSLHIHRLLHWYVPKHAAGTGGFVHLPFISISYEWWSKWMILSQAWGYNALLCMCSWPQLIIVAVHLASIFAMVVSVYISDHRQQCPSTQTNTRAHMHELLRTQELAKKRQSCIQLNIIIMRMYTCGCTHTHTSTNTFKNTITHTHHRRPQTIVPSTH